MPLLPNLIERWMRYAKISNFLDIDEVDDLPRLAEVGKELLRQRAAKLAVEAEGAGFPLLFCYSSDCTKLQTVEVYSKKVNIRCIDI